MIVIPLIVFLGTFALILSEKIHRTAVALVGGTCMALVVWHLGIWEAREPVTVIVESIENMEGFTTIGLILGMMIVVSILRHTGLFQWLAAKSVIFSGGSLWRMIIYLSLITAFLSAILPNVTTVLMIAPVTIEVARQMDIEPIPLLITEAMFANIGGTATLIGDPPNIMIGSVTRLTFMDFLIALAPVVIIIAGVSLLYVRIYYRDMFRRESQACPIIDVEIVDPVLLKKSLAVLAGVIALFIMQGYFQIDPATVALLGASVLLAISGLDPGDVLHEIEWTTLLFFAGLFVLVGGLERSGFLDMVAAGVASMSGSGETFNAPLVSTLVIWVSAITSAIVDNVPFTAAMIPFLQKLGVSAAVSPEIQRELWWSLALGACLGGNATLIGASPNLVVAGLAERRGHKISFIDFTKVAMPLTLLIVLVSNIYVLIRLSLLT